MSDQFKLPSFLEDDVPANLVGDSQFTLPSILQDDIPSNVVNDSQFTLPSIIQDDNIINQQRQNISPYDTIQLGDEEFTEDQLRSNPQWLKDARTIYRNEKNRDWTGTDEDLGSWLLNRQSLVGWNLTNAGLTAWDAQTWDPETKAAWYRSMDMYDRTDPTWRSRGKAAWWTLFDVPTVATLGWGPALRAVAGPSSNLAVRYSFKHMLKKALDAEVKKQFGKKAIGKLPKELGEKRIKEIRKDVAKRVAWRNALENYGPIGAAYNGLFDIAHQALETEVDPYKEDIDYKQAAYAGLAGYGIGGVLGYGIPRLIEKFTRGKSIRNLQEDEIVRDAELQPEAFDFDKNSPQQRRLAGEGDPETEIGEETAKSDAVLSFVGKIANLFNRQGIKPKVHDVGSGLPNKKGIIPTEQKLKGDADIDLTMSELPLNIEKVRRRFKGKKSPYVRSNEVPTGDKNIVSMSNIVGRYTDRTLLSAVLDKNARYLDPEKGVLVVNVGKQATRKMGDEVLETPTNPRAGIEKRKGELNKEFIETVEELPPDKQGQIKTKVIKDEKVGLNEDDLKKLLSNKFVNVKKHKVKGETVFTAMEPRKFTGFRKADFLKPKGFFHTIFSFRKNWTDSDLGMPKELDYYAGAKKNSVKKSVRRIQQVLNKRFQPAVEKFWSSKILNPANKDNRYWKNFSEAEQIEANRLADDFLRNDISPNDIQKIPQEVRSELVAMRKEVTDLQIRLEESGYIEKGSDLMTQIQSSRGKGNFLGLPELYLNRQYEIFDNAAPWIKKVLASQGDPEGVYEKARSFFKQQLRDDKEILNDPVYGGLAEDLQTLYDVKHNDGILPSAVGSPYSGKGRAWRDMNLDMKNEINKRIDEIEGKEIDNIVESFLRKYGRDELEDIKRLGAQGYFHSMKAGEGAPFKGIFFVRKEIPAPIRDLLGEYKNPRINFANTIMKLNQTYDNYKYENAIRELVKVGKFPDVMAPVKDIYGKEIATAGGKDLLEASALAKYAPGTDQPLANLKAEDVVFDAIKQGNELMPILNPAWKNILGLQAATRLAKTAYSVAAFPRNFAGAMLKALGAGNLNLLQMREFGKIAKGLKSFTDDEIAAEVEKGLHLGFLDSGARAGSLKAGLEDAWGNNAEAALTDAGVYLGKTAGELTSPQWWLKKLSRINRRILDSYQSMDDMWKWYSFVNEKKNYRQILNDTHGLVDDGTGTGKKILFADKVVDSWTTAGGVQIKITELDRHAAKMVRSHMDNYGDVARGVKFMRRLPTADFLAYKTEQYRTTRNIFQTALRDIREGKALQRQGLKNADGSIRGSAQLLQGYKRLGSIISALGLPVAAAGTAAWYLGMNDKATVTIRGKEYQLPYSKMDALREAAEPDYAAGSIYMPVGKQKEDGSYSFVNLSYIDPWAPWREPIMAALRSARGDRSLDEAFDKAAFDVGKNIAGHFGPSMLLDATLGAMFNFDKYGRSVIDREDQMSKQLADRTVRFIEAFNPNAIRDASRIYDSFKHGYTERGGFRLDPWRSIRKSVGIPSELVEPEIGLNFKMSPILKRIQGSGSTFQNSVRSFHIKSGEDIATAYRTSLEREYEAMNDLARLLVAAKSTGMSEKDIIMAVTKDGLFPDKLDKRIITTLVRNGKFIPSNLPIKKNLIMWAEHIKRRTGNKPPIIEIQRELNKIYREFAGATFPFANELIPVKKEED